MIDGQRHSIWIKIDRAASANTLIDGVALLEKWRSAGSPPRNIMPTIEAAKIGPVPVEAFKKIFLARLGCEELSEFCLNPFDEDRDLDGDGFSFLALVRPPGSPSP